ncbi:hypothetical protein SUS17_952 [Sphingomonas sp. S17]|nr:hypothetical protein SUS17_952 [Sphingomonas sp. S17]
MPPYRSLEHVGQQPRLERQWSSRRLPPGAPTSSLCDRSDRHRAALLRYFFDHTRLSIAVEFLMVFTYRVGNAP